MRPGNREPQAHQDFAHILLPLCGCIYLPAELLKRLLNQPHESFSLAIGLRIPCAGPPVLDAPLQAACLKVAFVFSALVGPDYKRHTITADNVLVEPLPSTACAVRLNYA